MQERKKWIIELISRSDDNHGKLNDSTLHTVSSHFFLHWCADNTHWSQQILFTSTIKKTKYITFWMKNEAKANIQMSLSHKWIISQNEQIFLKKIIFLFWLHRSTQFILLQVDKTQKKFKFIPTENLSFSSHCDFVVFVTNSIETWMNWF